MKELSEIKIINESKKYPRKCFDESHNGSHCLCNDTKLVIIGTITPKDFDYFYCAPRNKIYGYIDEVVGSNLKGLKQQLNATTSSIVKHNIVKKIKDTLKTNKIAFIDVMKYVIRDPKRIYSHDDPAIIYYSVDCATLSKIKNPSIIICNNRLSQSIVSKITGYSDITYIPQRGKGSSKSNWLNGIKDKL